MFACKADVLFFKADRIKKLETLAKLKAENEQMKQELKKYADNDPALLDAMSKYYRACHIKWV